MIAGRPLHVSIGPGLGFRFDLPDGLRQRVGRFLENFRKRQSQLVAEPVCVTSEPPALATDGGTLLLEEPPLVVRRAGELIVFELPRIQAWCDGAHGRAGIVIQQPSDVELDLFVGLALAPMLIELAPSRGWLGVHAAGIAIGGVGILLPGPSGAGKSTIFRGAHRAGHGVLSDDLVWLHPSASGTTMVAFPRGTGVEPAPGPTADDVALRAIVCPVIAGGENRLRPLVFSDALDVLVDQGGFLTTGAPAGDRFRALVRLARSVPAYRLEAGRRRQDVPALLADLAGSLAQAPEEPPGDEQQPAK